MSAIPVPASSRARGLGETSWNLLLRKVHQTPKFKELQPKLLEIIGNSVSNNLVENKGILKTLREQVNRKKKVEMIKEQLEILKQAANEVQLMEAFEPLNKICGGHGNAQPDKIVGTDAKQKDNKSESDRQVQRAERVQGVGRGFLLAGGASTLFSTAILVKPIAVFFGIASIALPHLGILLLIAGLLFLIIGAILKSKGRTAEIKASVVPIQWPNSLKSKLDSDNRRVANARINGAKELFLGLSRKENGEIDYAKINKEQLNNLKKTSREILLPHLGLDGPLKIEDCLKESAKLLDLICKKAKLAQKSEPSELPAQG